MRAIVIVASLVVATAVVATAHAEDSKKSPSNEAAVKCTTEHLDKSWNLSVKSCTAKEVVKESLGDQKFTPPRAFQEIRITLEFADEAASAKEIRRRFVPESKLPKVGEPALKEPQTQLCLFDGDNVLLKKLELWSVEGEITGVAGDAFRVVVYCEPELFKKVKKLELRPAGTK